MRSLQIGGGDTRKTRQGRIGDGMQVRGRLRRLDLVRRAINAILTSCPSITASRLASMWRNGFARKQRTDIADDRPVS